MAGSKSMIIWQGHIWQDEALGVTGRKGMNMISWVFSLPKMAYEISGISEKKIGISLFPEEFVRDFPDSEGFPKFSKALKKSLYRKCFKNYVVISCYLTGSTALS